MNAGEWVSIVLSVIALVGVLYGARMQFGSKKMEVTQKREDSAEQQEAILRGDLFKSWEREKIRADKTEEEKVNMAQTIAKLTSDIQAISMQAVQAVEKVSALTKRVLDLERELHDEKEKNAAKQVEISQLNQDVAGLNRKVARLENGNGSK